MKRIITRWIIFESKFYLTKQNPFIFLSSFIVRSKILLKKTKIISKIPKKFYAEIIFLKMITNTKTQIFDLQLSKILFLKINSNQPQRIQECSLS